MKRSAAAMILLAGMSGCMTSRSGDSSHGAGEQRYSCGASPKYVPGVQGPWGQPVPMVGPYTANPPSGEALAKQMMAQSVPLDLVHPHPVDAGVVPASGALPGAGSGIQQANYVPPPPGMSQPNMMSPPGIPGMPGPIQQAGGGGCCPPGAVAALGIPPGAANPNRFTNQRSEVRFVGPAGMKVSWYGMRADGMPGFGASTIEAPGRYNFAQGAVYRLKLSEIPNRPGVELYPTLEVVPSNLRTDAFIAHSAVPVFFTEDDFEQVANGNYVVKVIYLPYPQYADIAITGPDEVVSTRLEPGLDPIQEAMKRGSIMLVVRLGNIDLEAPNTPPMNAPNPYMMNRCGPMAGMPPAMPGAMAGMPPMMPPPPGMAGPPGASPAQLPAGMPVPAVPVKNAQPTPATSPSGKPVSYLPDPNKVQPVGYQK